MRRRSDDDFTGRKRERGTLMPLALRKCLMAAPTAVSSWMTARPSSVTLLLMLEEEASGSEGDRPCRSLYQWRPLT